MSDFETTQAHSWVMVNDDSDIDGWIEYECSDCGLMYEYRPKIRKRAPDYGYKHGRFNQAFYVKETIGDLKLWAKSWKPEDEPTCAEVKMMEALG